MLSAEQLTAGPATAIYTPHGRSLRGEQQAQQEATNKWYIGAPVAQVGPNLPYSANRDELMTRRQGDRFAVQAEVRLIARVGRLPAGQHALVAGFVSPLVLVLVDERFATDAARHGVFAVDPSQLELVDDR